MYAGARGLADTTESTELRDAQSRISKERTHTSGLGATKQQESEEEFEDYFSKEVETKVSKATPQCFNEGLSLPTIYVAPRDLAEGTKDAYEPAVVCIGPLFNLKDREEAARYKLERYKWCCVRKLIVNAGAGGLEWIPDVHAPLLRKCLGTMKGHQQQILASYGHSISMEDIGGSQDLALMMLLDGCFLLHRLLKYARKDKGEVDDGGDDDWTQVSGRCGIWGIVTRDLLLLKNQIPFFLLLALFKHLKSRASERDDVLVEGALRLFASLRPCPRPGSSLTIACGDVHHLLHLFYLSIDISPTQPLPESSKQPHRHDALPLELQGWVPCAKELEEAGVSFHARNKKQQQQQATTFLDVSFRRGVLEILPLELYDYSEALFRNLIAFEQTYLNTDGHITAYAIFMDCLIKTREDMRLLHHSGVLVSHLNGDRDVAMGFFSRVCAQTHIFPDRNYLAGVMGDIVTYQSARWPRWRAVLVRDYFRNPWVTTSFVAALFLLVMTVLQSFFAVYGYFKPPATH